MQRYWKWVAAAVAVAACVLFWFAGVARDYFDRDSIPNISMAYHLGLFGSATYEYHAATGQWPSSIDDFARTSVAARSPTWRTTAGLTVFLWPQDLRDNPKENAGVILAYWDKGLYNRLGRIWVCWGDLRTEHLPEDKLKAYLAKRKAALERPAPPR